MLKHSSLLIDEPPLVVQPSLAAAIGLEEALVLQQLHYWIRNKSQHHDPRAIYGGRYWVYNSIREWQETNFSFWSRRTVGRIFDRLIERKLVLTRQEDGLDRRCRYTIDYEFLQALLDTLDMLEVAGNDQPGAAKEA